MDSCNDSVTLGSLATAENPPILSLSNELLQEICAHLPKVQDTNFTQKSGGWEFCPNPGHHDLVNVSLVCKRFSGAAERYLALARFNICGDDGQHDVDKIQELEKLLKEHEATSGTAEGLRTLAVSFAHIPWTTSLSATPCTPKELIDTMVPVQLLAAESELETDLDSSNGENKKDDSSDTVAEDRVLRLIARLLNVAKSVEHLTLMEGRCEQTQFGNTGLGLISLALPTFKFLYSLSVSGEGDPAGCWRTSPLIMNILKIESLRSLKITKAAWYGVDYSGRRMESTSRVEHLELHLCNIRPVQLSCFIHALPYLQHFVYNAEKGYCRPRTKDMFKKFGVHYTYRRRFPGEPVGPKFTNFMLVSDKKDRVFHDSYRSDAPRTPYGTGSTGTTRYGNR